MLTNPRRDAAEHLHPDDLAALLSGSLAEDREALLAEHLAQCRSCSEALEQAAGPASWWKEAESFLAEDAASADAAVDPVAELRGWLAPTDDPKSMGRIGRFEVLGLAGRGATGVVFKAFEPTLNRYVALKVLSPILSGSDAARRRFDREARAAAAVNHEHVAPIYGVDEFRGLPYLTMQFVSGQTLAQRLAAHGPLGTVETARIALQTARALAAAHEQGVIHRDVKPGNILLESGIERAMVTDFGLARVVDDAAMTRTGAIAGTPQFMSPEQARGEPADARSDLYSLGAVMYAMCTGRPPFASESIVGLLRKVCDERPAPIREQNNDVPRWLEAIAEKLLSKRPEDRFASAHEVAAALAAELAYHQNPAGSRAPSRSWRRRRTAPWVFAGCFAGAAAIGGWALMRPSGQAAPNENVESSQEKPSIPDVSNPSAGDQATADPPAWSGDESLDASQGADDAAALAEELARLRVQVLDRERLVRAPSEVLDDAWSLETQRINEQVERLSQEMERDW